LQFLCVCFFCLHYPLITFIYAYCVEM
jgi:hypothetical protein